MESTFQKLWYSYGQNSLATTKIISGMMFAVLFLFFVLVIPDAPPQSWLTFSVIPLFIVVKTIVDTEIIEQYMRRYDADYQWHLRYNRGEW